MLREERRSAGGEEVARKGARRLKEEGKKQDKTKQKTATLVSQQAGVSSGTTFWH